MEYEDIDDSWLKDHKRLTKIQELESIKEPMDSIQVHYIYINVHSFIDKIITEEIDLHLGNDGVSSFISNDFLLQLIQSKKIRTPISKFKFKEVLLYNVELEPEHVQNYSNSESFQDLSKSFFKSIPIISDIVISPSIFIFHNVNCMYFIFQESLNEPPHSSLPKPILKFTDDSSKQHPNNYKKTKKVIFKINSKNTKKNLSGAESS